MNNEKVLCGDQEVCDLLDDFMVMVAPKSSFIVSVVIVLMFIKAKPSENIKNIISNRLENAMSLFENKIRELIYRQKSITQEDVDIYEKYNGQKSA